MSSRAMWATRTLFVVGLLLPPRPPASAADHRLQVVHQTPPGNLSLGGAESRSALPPCPCSPTSLCRSLSPQPPARPEVLAFSTAGWEYPNPTTVNKTEPFYFDHYPWGSVTTVAPFVGQGSGVDWGVDEYTPQLVCKAHQHNARVVGHIGHGAATWPEILSPSYRSRWVQQIVTWFIHTQGMDGIQFDIEALSGNYTAAATSLACELKQALTRALPGSTLSWCSDISPKVDPGYNFTWLSSCVDYFVVMEYTHGLGPTWEHEFSTGLSDYEAVGVRASQIVYALPFFGAQWACCNSRTVPPCPNEKAHGGVTCTHACWYLNQPCNGAIYPPRPFGYAGFAQIMETAALGNEVQYQPRLTPSPFIDITVNNTGPPTNMSMRFRWEFDDPRSVRAKATIMRTAKVGGVGMWTADALDYSNASRSSAMWRALLGPPTAAGVDESQR